MPEEVLPHPGTKTAATVHRSKQALELRRLGHNYTDIAQKLGYASHSGARHAVQRAMTDTLKEPAEELRIMEMARLDDLQTNLWPMAVDPENSVKDRIGASLAIAKLIGQRAKLMGLEYDERKFIRWEDVKTLLQLVASNVLTRYVNAEDVTQAKQELRRITRQADPKGQ